MSTPEGWRRSRRETWRAPAKINLWLSITGRLPDGYHTVDTCYQAIDLSDRVVLEPSEGGVPLVCDVAGEMVEGVPRGLENLAARAALKLAERTGHELRLALTIDKTIPAGAGLGGGSSDAAAVLVGLARRFAVPDPEHTLSELARELGADVPFFLLGGTQRAGGAGERLVPVDPPAERWGVLVYSGIPVSTAWAYRAYDEAMETVGRGPAAIQPVVGRPSPPVRSGAKSSDPALGGRLPADWKSRGNALEPVVLERHPEVRRALEVMMEGPAVLARMSGSGSAVFALYSDATARDHDLARVLERPRALKGERAWAFTCVSHGVTQVAAPAGAL